MTSLKLRKGVLIAFSSVLLVLFAALSQPVTPALAKQAPSVDPETVRSYSYIGNPTVGLWLNQFDENGKCVGNTYAVFSAAAPFNQFGFPAIWAGRAENNSAAEFTASIYAFNESPEKSFESEPLFSETIYQNGDNVNGAIYPMGKILPAGQYVLSCTQNTGKTSDGSPYVVIPTGTSSKSEHYIEYGGVPGGHMCFFVDFLRDDTLIDYFLPMRGGSAAIISADESAGVYSFDRQEGAQKLNPGDTFAVLTKTIPEDKYLYTFTFTSMPTWSNNGPGSNLAYEVYKWDKSYEKTISSNPVAAGEVRDHLDNQLLVMSFGTSLPGGERYLIVVRSSGTMSIGFWVGFGTLHESNWEMFWNGTASNDGPLPSCSYVTAKIEYVEVETPPAGSTEAPGPTPPAGTGATPGPDAATPMPGSEPSTESKKSSGCGGNICSPLCLTVVIAVFTVLFFKKSHVKNI